VRFFTPRSRSSARCVHAPTLLYGNFDGCPSTQGNPRGNSSCRHSFRPALTPSLRVPRTAVATAQPPSAAGSIKENASAIFQFDEGNSRYVVGSPKMISDRPVYCRMACRLVVLGLCTLFLDQSAKAAALANGNWVVEERCGEFKAAKDPAAQKGFNWQ